MASNDERRALLEALAKDGPAGADAYRKAQQQAQQAQHAAAVRLLSQMGGPEGGSDRQNARFAFETGAYSNPAIAEAQTAAASWDDQVGYEQRAIGKLYADTQEQIDDAWRTSNNQLDLDRRRSQLDRQLTEHSDAAARNVVDAQTAAQAQPTPSFTPMGPWDAVTGGEKPRRKISDIVKFWG